MKVLLGLLMVFGMASEVLAAQAICVAKARAPHTRSRVQNHARAHGNLRGMLKQTCRQALRRCRQKARRPRNCETIRAIVKFPGLENRFRIGRGGRWGGGRF